MVHHTLLISLVFRLVLADNGEATGLNCSQIASVEKQSCGQVNSSVCGELGCCWNENEADSKLRCFNKSVSPHVGNTSTKCSAYQGQACRHSFLSTLSTFNTSARFHKVQQNASEAFLELSITFIATNVSHPECRSALVAMLCHDVMPPCSTLNNSAVQPWQLCASECSQIYAQCEPFVSQVSSVVNRIAEERGLNLSFPVCSGLKNASELDEASNDNCLKLGLNFTSSPEATEKPVIPPVFPREYDCSNRIPPEEKEACPIQNNQTMCAVIGCCWNATEEPTACFTKRGGTCMLYDGDICRTSFNSTLLTYKNSRRFFDNKFGLYFTEFFLRIAMGVIMDDDYVNDEKCRHILSNMLCHYTLPPCYPDNSIIDYCREDCLAIFQDCSAPLNRVIGAIKFLVKDKNIDFVHTALPNCSRHQTSQYYRDLPGNKTCIHTGFFRFTEDQMAKTTPNPPEDDNKLEIILPIVLIGLVVIVVCVAVFMFRRRSQRKKDAVDNGSALTHKGSMTMRDRLRAESLKSIDSRLMRLYDPNKLKQYRLDHVAYVKDLGEGFFGKVFQGRAAGLVDGQPKKVIPVAVKALKTDPSKEQKEEFFREVTLMSILQHPNVVELLAVSTEEEPFGMVFEFMSGGDLNQYLRGAKPAEASLNSNEKAKVYLSQEDLVSMATQIATGMQFLTELKFVHRDLAARNVLVGEELVVKIADFGMSRDIYSSDYYKMSKETMLPIRWLAPEAFLYGKFSLKSDVYAYGVVLWEIFTFGLQPYYGYTNKEVTDFIKKGIHLGKPDNCPDFMYAIMKDCWHKEPEKRLNFSVIGSRLNDPYNNYDVPPSSDTEEGIDAIDSAEPDSGNYDVPRSPTTSDYDIPRSAALESTYDVPRSSEDLRMSYAEDEDNTTREKNGQVYV